MLWFFWWMRTFLATNIPYFRHLSKSPLTWIEAATAYFFLLIPVFWLTNYSPFWLVLRWKRLLWTKEIFQFLYFLWTSVASSLFTLCDYIYLLLQKKKLRYSIDLNVLKKLLSKHVTNFWLASKMIRIVDSNRSPLHRWLFPNEWKKPIARVGLLELWEVTGCRSCWGDDYMNMIRRKR